MVSIRTWISKSSGMGDNWVDRDLMQNDRQQEASYPTSQTLRQLPSNKARNGTRGELPLRIIPHPIQLNVGLDIFRKLDYIYPSRLVPRLPELTEG